MDKALFLKIALFVVRQKKIFILLGVVLGIFIGASITIRVMSRPIRLNAQVLEDGRALLNGYFSGKKNPQSNNWAQGEWINPREGQCTSTLPCFTCWFYRCYKFYPEGIYRYSEKCYVKTCQKDIAKNTKDSIRIDYDTFHEPFQEGFYRIIDENTIELRPNRPKFLSWLP